MDVAILEQLGDEMGLKSAKMSQESGQDEPRWVKMAKLVKFRWIFRSPWGVRTTQRAAGTPPPSSRDYNSRLELRLRLRLRLRLKLGTWNWNLELERIGVWVGFSTPRTRPNGLRHGGGYNIILLSNDAIMYNMSYIYIYIHIYIYIYTHTAWILWYILYGYIIFSLWNIIHYILYFILNRFNIIFYISYIKSLYIILFNK